MTTGKNNMSPWIAVNETGLVPSSGHLFHKVEADLRSIRQVIGRQSKVLNGVLYRSLAILATEDMRVADSLVELMTFESITGSLSFNAQ